MRLPLSKSFNGSKKQKFFFYQESVQLLLLDCKINEKNEERKQETWKVTFGIIPLVAQRMKDEGELGQCEFLVVIDAKLSYFYDCQYGEEKWSSPLN